ncbi:unnamed protein product, partial [Mesorhabditis belari]|uniref:Uncharacterized protein n=1 Tax=Mesorhabditis belari TaxID=2138241 RepID=A0AAF3FJG8_9BILA
MKVVIVTGASAGIGKGIAVYFASKGFAISITARSQEGLEKTKAECVAAGCPEEKIVITAGDLTVMETCKKIVSNTISKLGSIDVLVNNAGFGIIGYLETFSMEDYDKQMNLNLRTVHQMTTTALPEIIKSKGNIVNISSICSQLSWAMSGMYCVSKAALDMYTKCLSLEMGPKGVRVNSVNPGLVETEFQIRAGLCTADNREETLGGFARSHPIGRGGKPQEIAAMVYFLASAESGFTTGSIVVVDGGRSVGIAEDPNNFVINK